MNNYRVDMIIKSRLNNTERLNCRETFSSLSDANNFVNKYNDDCANNRLRYYFHNKRDILQNYHDDENYSYPEYVLLAKSPELIK